MRWRLGVMSGNTDRHKMEDDNARRSISSEVEEFVEFFKDVHGYEPFPWQARLMEQVLARGEWPKVIDLPTGTGKTAVLDVAIFAMSCRPETSPRRIVFVIDRRIVVDQVYERAQKIRDKIKEGGSDALAKVGERLKKHGGGEEPLGLAMLRGGIPIDNEWARHPDQPWVMVSTVDQFGSCMLFRGYVSSRRMRPIYAGLAGNDCLVILDEVHLSTPFAHTLASLAKLESTRVPRRFAIVEMSATPSDIGAERFRLDPATDLGGCEELSRRIRVAKPAELVTVTDDKAVPGEVLSILKSISGKAYHTKSVGVVVNRVATARATYCALRDSGYDVALVTGRMRPLDKVGVLERIRRVVDPDRKEEESDRLSVVVATQAIEVGADFSFDAMITECAAVDSLRQRFGRLDRRGKFRIQEGSTSAWIIGPKSTVGSTKQDPIYGESTKATWKELERRKKAGSLDVGPLMLDEFPDEAVAPKLCAPLLQRTHLEAWAQTSPEPIIQPPIDWFLHGIGSEHEPDVSIAWRLDRTKEVLKNVPPRQAECAQVRIGEAKSWLKREGLEAEDDAGSTGNDSYTSAKPDWILWRGPDDIDDSPAADSIRPGDIIIVDPRMGGLTDGTWDPQSTDPVDDLGDYAQLQHRGRITLRLDPDLTKGNPPKPSDENLESTPARERIVRWLEEQRDAMHKHQDSRLGEVIMNLGNDFEIIPVGADSEHGSGYYILLKSMVDTTIMQGTDESESQIGTNATLRDHLEGVGERARDVAKRLNLPDDITDDLYLAGMLHDIGKVDRRFQAQLVGWDPVELERQKAPLAKSLPGMRHVQNHPRGSAQEAYPRGMRHEVASVALLESNKSVLDGAHDRDLVMYLVGVHHGWGRPLPPIIRDASPQALSYEFRGHQMNSSSDLTTGALAASMAERFWRLAEEYGHYGLAWFEAILRLSDHQQSAEEGNQ